MHIFESILSLLGLSRPAKSHQEVVLMVLKDLSLRSAESPYGIAIDIDADLSMVEEAIQGLEALGTVRRSARQIVVPDDGEEIPRVYVRYELAGSPA